MAKKWYNNIKIMEPNLKVKEPMSTTGRVIVRSHPAGSIAYFEKMIARAGQDRERRREVMAMIRSGKIESDNHNLIMKAQNVGKDLIIQYLLSGYVGSLSYPLGINYGAIGTSATAPAVTDTQINTEYARSVVSFAQDSSYNLAILQFFFSDAVLSNQTYYEFGTFINGSNTPNSGQIFNHSLFSSPFVKTAGIDLTVEVDITLT